MVKVLPEPVTPSRTWVRSERRTPSTRSSIACGWSPLRLELGLDDEFLPAFGFLRARRAVRRPHFAAAGCAGEFGTALAQQFVQRLAGGDAGKAARLRRQIGARQPVFGSRRRGRARRRASGSRPLTGGPSNSACGCFLVPADFSSIARSAYSIPYSIPWPTCGRGARRRNPAAAPMTSLAAVAIRYPNRAPPCPC